MEEDIRGQFVIRDKGNGIKYKVYVPENVNEDTPILVYTMGAALNDSSKNQEWQDIQQALIENNSDTIVIFPNHQSDCNDYFWTYPEVVMEMVNDVKETYGTNTTNIMNLARSAYSKLSVSLNSSFLVTDTTISAISFEKSLII